MKKEPLPPEDLDLILSVLQTFPEIKAAILFGSRAKGTHSDRSDIDLALKGPVDSLKAEAIAAHLDELPLPYRFGVLTLNEVYHQPLRRHIERVGVVLYQNEYLAHESQ